MIHGSCMEHRPGMSPFHTHGVGGAGWRKFWILRGRTQAGPFLLQGSVQAMEMSWWHHHTGWAPCSFPTARPQGTGDKSGDTADWRLFSPRMCWRCPEAAQFCPDLSPASTSHRDTWLRLKHFNEDLIPRVIHSTPNSEAVGGVLLRQRICFYSHLQSWSPNN